MTNHWLCSWAILGALVLPAAAQTRLQPAVAFVDGKTLAIAAQSGEIVKSIPLRAPLFDFAISEDLTLLVTVSPLTRYGGALEIVHQLSKKHSRLISEPVYFKKLGRGEREVYSDPRISPDGRQVAFAIHVDSPGDGNDVISASGPIGIVDLATLRVRVLKATTDEEGQGNCFANTPLWSFDGKWILFNCEDGASITDTQGTHLRVLKMGTDDKPLGAAIGWVGRNCVLYVQSADWVRFDTYEPRLLDLTTSKSWEAASIFAVPRAALAGLSEASDAVAIGQSSSNWHVETVKKSWDLPKAARAHILVAWSSKSVPHVCE